MLEHVYQRLLVYELQQRGLPIATEVSVPLRYKSLNIENAFRADIVVNQAVVLEIKSVESLMPVHAKQLLTYLKLMDLRLGLLINFNETLLKSGLKRVVNGLQP